ncbi:hypothetical protein, partial [Gordonibacter pamelaeae]
MKDRKSPAYLAFERWIASELIVVGGGGIPPPASPMRERAIPCSYPGQGKSYRDLKIYLKGIHNRRAAGKAGYNGTLIRSFSVR